MIGQRIGQYRVVRELGRGGMGLVYEAQHETMPRLRAAIKVLYASASAEELERFEREARVLSTLQDSGIVRIEDFGSLPDGSLYLRMEYLEGETLEKRLKRLRRLPGRQALELARQMATTLDRIHHDKILHRDLKPANIIVVRDSQAEGGELARLLDFGIAKLLSPDQRSRTGPVGTPLYMSPEQGDAKAVLSDRSDVYQLGLVLYEMLSGHVPFEVAEDSLAIALHIQRLTVPPIPLRKHLPYLPTSVEELVFSMLQRSPQARPTMRSVAQRLKRLLAKLPTDVDWQAAPSTAQDPAGSASLRETGDIAVGKEISGVSAELARRSVAPGSPTVQVVAPRSPWRTTWARTPVRGRVVGGALVALTSAAVLPALWSPLDLVHRGPIEPTKRPGTPGNQTTAPEGTPPPPVKWDKLGCATVTAADGMACIPGDLFVPGASEAELRDIETRCRATEAPARCEHEFFVRQSNQKEVLVPTFQIDRRETSNASYAEFLNKEIAAKLATVNGIFVYLGDSPTAALNPSGGLHFSDGQIGVRPGYENKPVSYVTWYGAESYCRKRGMHLPTELQFEFAARGAARRPYPWGSAAPTCKGVAFARDTGLPCGSELGPRDVGASSQDVTPEGVADLAGNLQEWVANDFSLHLQLSCRGGVCLEAPSAQPAPRSAGDSLVRSVRGGTWVSGATQLYSSWRSRWDAHMADVSLGFRCAAAPAPSP